MPQLTNQSDEGPMEEKYKENMLTIGEIIDKVFNEPGKPRTTAFCLLVFPVGQGDDHRSNYISNANREDMIATMKEFIARAEGRYHA